MPVEDRESSATITPWGADDLQLLQRLLGDPEMMEHLGGPESDDEIAARQARYVRPGSGCFKIVTRSGRDAGWVGVWERSWRGERVLEIGWSVLPELQGRGLASVASAALIEHAATAYKVRVVHAFPGVDNGASNGLCRKLGFELQGAIDHEYPPGNIMRVNDWRLDLDSPRRGEQRD